MIRISPSLASSHLLDIRLEIQKAESAQAHTLHIDIEDGNYIPNITFGLRMVSSVREVTEMNFSYHLMMSRPLSFLDGLPLREGDYVFIHGDSTRYPQELLTTITHKGATAGLAFNPASALCPYRYLFKSCGALLILTSEPDARGQKYIPAMEEKIRQTKETGIPEIWIDGGVSPHDFPRLETYGVSDAVLGRAFFQD